MSQRWWPVVAVLGVLVATDLMLINQSMVLTVPVACAATALLVWIARREGLSWNDLGLGRANVGRGLRWGLSAAGLVVVGYAVVLLSPWGDQLLADDRTPQELSALLLKVLVIIPLRTVMLEEIGFRGVLWAQLRSRCSATVATLGSAAAFGLWHLPPAFLLMRTNSAVSGAAGGSTLATVAVVLAIIVVTGVAGILFAELERRSGSVLAPMGLHAATNMVGTVASFVA